MYLGLLKESQKEMFLELAINLAKSDGDYSEEEHAIITSYCQEMQISFERDKKNRSIDELVSEFALLCTAQEKKIIAFEIIGLAMCDNVYHEKEKTIIEKMRKEFGLGNEFLEKCKTVIKEYIELQKKINGFMFS